MTPAFWQLQFAALKQDYELYMPQIPGILGGNPKPSIADYADYIHLKIQQAGIEIPVLIGHSMGGAVVLQLLLKYPQYYPRALLSNTGARLKVLPVLLQMLLVNPNGWVTQMQTAAKDLPPELLPQLLPAISHDPLAPLLQFKACDHFDVMGQLQAITADVAVVVASQDQNTPPKYGEYLAHHIPGAQLHRFSGGHLTPFGCAYEFNQLIKNWLLPADD